MPQIHSIVPTVSEQKSKSGQHSASASLAERPSLQINGHGVSVRIFNNVKPMLLQTVLQVMTDGNR